MNSASERQRRREGAVFLVLFALTIPAANWLIGHVGTACIAPQGPCVLPVAPGVMAPSGVIMVGVALVSRDLVQRRLGTGLSALPALILASAVAFLSSEFADLATRSCSCGSRSARLSSCPAKSSARLGWCCCQSRSWVGCAAATNASV